MLWLLQGWLTTQGSCSAASTAFWRRLSQSSRFNSTIYPIPFLLSSVLFSSQTTCLDYFVQWSMCAVFSLDTWISWSLAAIEDKSWYVTNKIIIWKEVARCSIWWISAALTCSILLLHLSDWIELNSVKLDWIGNDDDSSAEQRKMHV